MKAYINERWRSILAHNGLSDFDALWKLQAEWFEEPNFRRGGWSGVSRCGIESSRGRVVRHLSQASGESP